MYSNWYVYMLSFIIRLPQLQHPQANSALTQLAPWSSDTSPQVTRACYDTSLEVLRVSGICLQPFVPALAGRLLDALGVGHTERSWAFTEVGRGKLIVKRGVRLFEGFDNVSRKAKGKGKGTSEPRK